jgi:hypothetical protein
MTAQAARSRCNRLCARRQSHYAFQRGGSSVLHIGWPFTHGSAAGGPVRGASRQKRRVRNAGRVRCFRGDLLSCAFFSCTRGCGRITRPAFRAPSACEGRAKRFECERARADQKMGQFAHVFSPARHPPAPIQRAIRNPHSS